MFATTFFPSTDTRGRKGRGGAAELDALVLYGVAPNTCHNGTSEKTNGKKLREETQTGVTVLPFFGTAK